MKFDWKKLFKQKKLSELTDEQLTKRIKTTNLISAAMSILFLAVVAFFALGAIGLFRFSSIVPLSPILSNINTLILISLGGLILVLPLSIIAYITSAKTMDLVITELTFEKRLREVKKEILEANKQ